MLKKIKLEKGILGKFKKGRLKIFKRIVVFFVYTFVVIVAVPCLITRKDFSIGNKNNFVDNFNNDLNFSGEVFSGDYEIQNDEKSNFVQKKSSHYEENPQMESYIIGVVAAEMPVSFEIEALKAQAVAARTYAYRQVGTSEINPDKLGQAYISVDEMKKRWGNDFEQNYNKVKTAVESTKNQIMVYDGEPILAAFHSTSGGVTENSENVWSEKLNYLKSVDSHEDENAPDFLHNSEFKMSEFKEIFSKDGCKFSDNLSNDVSIVKRTDAGYVLTIKIGGKEFKGKDVRTKLSLRSTNFTISFKGDKIIFTTKGYGHGAGMSQYGANFMAKNKKNYKEILLHYYYGVEFILITG